MEAADGTTGGEGKDIAAWPDFPWADNRQNISALENTERMETPLQPAWDRLGTWGHQSASGAEPTCGLVATYLVHHFRAFSQTFGLFLSCRANVVLLPFSDTCNTYSSHGAFLPSPTTQHCYRNWKLKQNKSTKQPGWEVDLSSGAPAAVIVPLPLVLDMACQQEVALQWCWHLIGFCLVPGLIVSFLPSSCCRKNRQCSDMMVTGKNYECVLCLTYPFSLKLKSTFALASFVPFRGCLLSSIKRGWGLDWPCPFCYVAYQTLHIHLLKRKRITPKQWFSSRTCQDTSAVVRLGCHQFYLP